MAILRSAFVAGLVFIVWFFGTHYDSLTIDTDIKDVSPALTDDPGLRQALKTVSKNAENQIRFIIEGSSSEAVAQASEYARRSLSKIPHLSVQNIESTEQVVMQLLHPYRFSMLLPERRTWLEEHSSSEIAEDARRALFELGATPRLLPFNGDPFGWFSEYMLESMGAIGAPISGRSSAGFFQGITVRINQGALDMAQQGRILELIENFEQELAKRYQVKLFRSGVFFFAAHAASTAKRDIQRVSTLSSMGVLLLLIMAFRSIWPIALATLSVLLGLAFASAVVHSVYGAVHILTIVFGASLIGIAVDYALHFICHLSEQNKDKQRSAKLNRAMILSVLTSLIGYGALSFSNLDALQKVALFSCCGLAMAWLTVMSLGPYVRSRPKNNRYMAKILGRLRKSLPDRLVKTGAALAITNIAVLWGIFGNGMGSSDDPRLFFRAPTDQLAQERKVAELVGGYEPGRFIVVKGQSTNEVYDRLNDLAAHFPAANEGKTLSMLDLLPAPREQLSNHQAQSKLYEENGALSLLYSSLGAKVEDAAPLVTAYHSAQNQVLAPTELFSALSNVPKLWVEIGGVIYTFLLLSNSADLKTLEATSVNQEDVEFINTVALAENALRDQRHSASTLLILAYLFVGILLWWTGQRSGVLAMLAIPISATTLCLMILDVSGQAITLFHLMALFLVLGLGMDYAIFAREMEDQTGITLQAILLSAATTLLSFGLLSTSAIPVVQAFSITVFLGNALNLLGVLLYLKLKEPLINS